MPYRTVLTESTAKISEKKSVFIGNVKPVVTEKEAMAFIGDLKAKYYDARHNVYAYSLGNGKIVKFSDDGEPSSTAGAPILDVLVKNNITDVVMVVTRYFGGVLLGKGGLIRAYSSCAKLTLDNAQIIEKVLCNQSKICCGYDSYERIKNLIYHVGGKVTDTCFNESVRIEFIIKEKDWDSFLHNLNNITLGEIALNKASKVYCAFN